jgi:putative polyketide hydroxylase
MVDTSAPPSVSVDPACTVDVLIVGAGPVGLSMAIALRHFGVDCVVIDKHDSPMDFPRGRGITVRTMELMRRWGLEAPLRAAGLPASEVAVFSGDNLLAATFVRHVAPAPHLSLSSPSAPLVCFQNVTEVVLRDAAIAAGADVRYGWELLDAVDDGDRVTATLVERSSGRESTLAARWLVAADGAHSPTRNRLGISRHGPGVVGHAVSLVIETDLRARTEDRASVLYRITDLPGGTLMGMDNDRHRWGLIYEYDPTVDPAESFTEPRLLQLARTAIGDPEVEIEITGHRFWESTALVADRFRHGRIFLVGDAAHVTTPIGGLGMNCGIGDVDNLSWKLAAVVSGWAHESLLDTYEAERRPVAEQTVEASLGRARPPAPIEGLVLGASYSSSAVVPDGTMSPEQENPIGDYVPTARPGHRAPHLWLDDTHTQSTLDLFGNGFVLLTTAAGTAWHAARLGESRIPIRVHEINHPDWPALYGIGPFGAVLVRPDGYVAWRSPRESIEPNELGHALSIILGRAGLKPD